MRTVELLLDPNLDAEVRALWQLLHRAGLRSLATHTHPTNRPHITVATAASVARVPQLRLPIPIRLGPPRSLGKALVLAADSAELRDLHDHVWTALGDDDTPDWVPHVSLALNMPPDQHGPARERLTGIGTLTGACVAARSYDSETRTISDIRWGDAETR
jgi:hypothetical protein